MNKTEHHHIIIIGAGLSGLYTAWQLQKNHDDIIILEARNRCGGRIFCCENQSSQFDMGPAWVWPQMQPRLSHLLNQLSLKSFKQYTNGMMIYEKSPIDIEHYQAQSSHAQSYRIEGGVSNLIDHLINQQPESRLHLNTQVTHIEQSGLKIQTLKNNKIYHYTADKIIFALPPRLILQNINISPNFSDEILDAWKNIATWMSTHCKIIFIYKKPFWREHNFSGEVFSHHGPLSEIYDASTADEKLYALTAFVGLNAQQRKQMTNDQLINAAKAQLLRLLGDESQNILDIKLKDWSNDMHTTSKLDLSTPMQHPQYNQNLPRDFWNKTLFLAGTEVAREFGGYLEGALESADEILDFFN